MKSLLAAVLVAVAVCALGLTRAEAAVEKYFNVTGTAGGATNNWVIIPANGGAAPVVTSWNIISDQAGRVAVFSNGPPIAVTGGTSNTVNVSTNSLPGYGTNGFTVGDVVIVQRASGIAERMLYTTNAGGGLMGLGFGGTLWTNAFQAGDTIYRVNTNITFEALANGNVTNVIGAPFILGGKYGQPLLIEIITTAAGRIKGVSGFYDFPPKGGN